MQKIKSNIKKFFLNPKVKKCVGIFLVIFGFIGLVTPFTPWGFLFFIGLEMIGVRFLFIDKIKKRFMIKNISQKCIKKLLFLFPSEKNKS